MYGADGNPWLTFSLWIENDISKIWVDANFGEWLALHKLEKPLTHVWMHICADIDTKSGNFSFSLNGRNMLTAAIDSLTINKPNILSLEIGLSKVNFVGGVVKQFHGSVTNIHLFKIDKKVSIEQLSSNLCDYQGDYMSWKDAIVELKGENVKQTKGKDDSVCGNQSEMKVMLPSEYTLMEAQHHCEVLGGGRIPGINDINELQEDVTLVKESQSECTGVWLPLSDDEQEGVWRNTNTGQKETFLPWALKQPNGGRAQNSVALSLEDLTYNDLTATYKFCASCTLNTNTTFRLQGLCPQSYLGDMQFIVFFSVSYARSISPYFSLLIKHHLSVLLEGDQLSQLAPSGHM